MTRRWQTLTYLASVLDQLGLLEESMRFREQTIALGDALLPTLADRDLDRMAGCRISLAQLVDRMGDRPRAKQLLRENVRLLTDTARISKAPSIALNVLFSRQTLGLLDPSEALPALDRLDPTKKREPYFALFNSESEALSATAWAEQAPHGAGLDPRVVQRPSSGIAHWI